MFVSTAANSVGFFSGKIGKNSWMINIFEMRTLLLINLCVICALLWSADGPDLLGIRGPHLIYEVQTQNEKESYG